MSTPLASPITQTPEEVYAQAARDLLQAQLAGSPDWLQAVKLQALSRYETLGFPTRRQEAWKYINVRPLLSIPLQDRAAEPKVCPPALQRHLLGENNVDVVRLIFINGRFREDLSAKPALPEGAFIGNLQAALKAQPQIVEQYLARNGQEEPDAFAALNTALFEDGVFVYLPENAQFGPLLQLVYVNFGEERRATAPRNLIVLGKHARISLVIEHLGLSQAICFDNSVNEFVLDEHAKAECTFIFSEGPQGWHLASTQANVQANACLSLNTITLAGQAIRHSIRPVLKGEEAHIYMNALDVLEGKTEVYHHTVAEHWEKNGVSDQLYKSILDDDSKSEFNSLVFVAKGAVGTDSHQLNKSLLLSENARVWTRPQLQINADDVKCAHGAAVGQLDEKQLFYLASRGLSLELAQALLTYGFAEDIIERISNPLVRQYLDKRVLANLHRTDAAIKEQLGA